MRIFRVLFFLTAVAAWTDLLPLHQALEQQIEEDLAGLLLPCNTRELFHWFQRLSEQNCQAIYCKIRGNKIEILSSPVKDENRNGYILSFFTQLGQKYSLPDVDLVIYTGDGVNHDSDYPIFAMAAGSDHKRNVCLIPDHEALAGAIHMDLILQASREHPWEGKINKGFFRGASTGTIDPQKEFCANDRVKAVVFSSVYPELLDADFNAVYQECVAEVIRKLPNKSVTQPLLPFPQWLAYKYLLDIDGNSCTYARCRWILLSNSALLKVSSNNIQWYYKSLIPYVNYIPVRNDLSDLNDIFEWLKTHDRDAFEIAMNGERLGIDIFSKESIEIYVLKLLEGYAKKIELREYD